MRSLFNLFRLHVFSGRSVIELVARDGFLPLEDDKPPPGLMLCDDDAGQLNDTQ